MMEEKKGVSAWLRGIVDESYGKESRPLCTGIAETFFGVKCREMPTCGSCILEMLTAIAYRIDAERSLPEGIEWPRFEDGELVKVGDEVGSDEPFTAKEIAFESERWLIKASSRSAFGCFRGAFGERVKRPAPKVFDADGAPIEVGDVVYYDGEPHPLTVVGITRDGKDALVDANGEESCVEGGRPQDFSHDAPKPVLDADGVPIKVGDTVWATYDGRKHIVMAVCADGSLHPEMVTDDGCMVEYEEGLWDFAKKVTHEQPDSWEKLEEDAMGRACELAGSGHLKCSDCEWGKEGIGCQAMARLEILKRAKKLAGIEEGAQR